MWSLNINVYTCICLHTKCIWQSHIYVLPIFEIKVWLKSAELNFQFINFKSCLTKCEEILVLAGAPGMIIINSDNIVIVWVFSYTFTDHKYIFMCGKRSKLHQYERIPRSKKVKIWKTWHELSLRLSNNNLTKQVNKKKSLC